MRLAKYLLIATFFLNCNNSKNNEKIVEIDRLKFHNDTIFNFYENGKIKSTMPFPDGKKNGVATWYYNNGKKEAEVIFYNNKQVGDAYYYFSNGNIEDYFLFDGYGILRYKIGFDSLGNITYQEGKPMYTILTQNLDSIKVNEEVNIRINCAKLEFFSTNVNYTLYEDKIVTTDQSYEVLEKRPYLKFTFDRVGKKKLKIMLTMARYTNEFPILISDTINLEIHVL